MLDLGNFDDVKESGTPKPKLKEGYNDVTIVNAIMKDNKNQTGKFIQVDVVDSNDAQASAFFNVEHVKEQVQNIGKGQFKNLCIALGYSAWVTSLDDIIGKEVVAVVKLEESSFLGNDGTMVKTMQPRITGFKPKNSVAKVVVDVDDDPLLF